VGDARKPRHKTKIIRDKKHDGNRKKVLGGGKAATLGKSLRPAERLIVGDSQNGAASMECAQRVGIA
jgi:hypothetical protein